ncbi:MAG: precorrin-8X methylmutase [Nitrospinae bacterium]|nr:precorrin-8X methylmutase [Nitrospinota bacterium]
MNININNQVKKKKGVLVIAHGSRRDEANQQVLTLVKRLRDYFQTDMFEGAFMELASPSIKDGIKTLSEKGIEELIVSPFFLFIGMHYSKDVPALIREAIEEIDGRIGFKMLKPVGMHPEIFDLLKDILYEDIADQLEFKHLPPSLIEDRSMDIIENYIGNNNIPADQKPVIKRVIHTTGDFDFLKSMIFSEDAVSEGMKAVREKKIIYTDVTMVQAGINKRFGHEVRCILNNPEVVKGAEIEGLTKAAYSIKMLNQRLDGNIVAIGNAPTALTALVDMIRHENVRPALIVGVPVGFVNAIESKEYLSTIKEVPYITNRGRKGGSTVAAAIVNALIKMGFAGEEKHD